MKDSYLYNFFLFFYYEKSVIPLFKQVELFEEYQARLEGYLGPEMAKKTISEGVYAISIGTNDFIENYFTYSTPRFLEFTPERYVQFLIDLAREFIVQIYMLGARKIGFTGVAPFHISFS